MRWSVIALAATVAACEASATQREGEAPVERSSYDVTVVAVSERPPLSGVLATFVELRGRDAAGGVDSYYLPYLREDDVPRVGARCRLEVHLGEVRGLVGKEDRTIRKARIIDRAECG